MSGRDVPYTHGHHASVLRSHSWRTAANSAGYLLPHLRPGMTVLDVGCGPGTITVDLAHQVAPARVVGIDTSPDVVHQARAHASLALGSRRGDADDPGHGLATTTEIGRPDPGNPPIDRAVKTTRDAALGGAGQPDADRDAMEPANQGPDKMERGDDTADGPSASNVQFVMADLWEVDPSRVGVDADRFDVVHAHQVLQHLPDPVGGLRRMAELARRNGLVAARDADYGAMRWSPADERLDRWLALIRTVTRRNGGEPDAGRYLFEWAHAAGLTNAIYSSSTWTFATPYESSWWGDLWAERTTASDFARQAQDYGLASPDDLAAMADAWRSWAAHPDGVFTVVHGEILAHT